jgi:hypothetical protein
VAEFVGHSAETTDDEKLLPERLLRAGKRDGTGRAESIARDPGRMRLLDQPGGAARITDSHWRERLSREPSPTRFSGTIDLDARFRS